MNFGDILGSFWEAFRSILGCKSRSKFGALFAVVFFTITRRDAGSTGLRRDFGGTSAQVFTARSPPGRRLFRAEGSYKLLKSKAKTASIAKTRSNTPWARGPANLKRVRCWDRLFGLGLCFHTLLLHNLPLWRRLVVF